MSTQVETMDQRVERELASLREQGFLKKELPTITMSTFHKLPPKSQSEFIRAGGKLTDDPRPPKSTLPTDGILKSKFDALSNDEKWKFIRGGGKLYDDEDYFEPKEKAESEIEAMRRKLKGKLRLQGMSDEDVDTLFETEQE